MLLDLNPTSILASLIGSTVGFVYVRLGRSESDWSLIGPGIGLMAYSYFVTSPEGLVLIGAAIAAIPFAIRRFG
jgi:hypothetical protein